MAGQWKCMSQDPDSFLHIPSMRGLCREVNSPMIGHFQSLTEAWRDHNLLLLRKSILLRWPRNLLRKDEIPHDSLFLQRILIVYFESSNKGRIYETRISPDEAHTQHLQNHFCAQQNLDSRNDCWCCRSVDYRPSDVLFS